MRPSYTLMEALSKAREVADITGYAAIRDMPGEPDLYYVDGFSADDLDGDLDDGSDPPSLDDVFNDDFDASFQNLQAAVPPQNSTITVRISVEHLLDQTLLRLSALSLELAKEKRALARVAQEILFWSALAK